MTKYDISLLGTSWCVLSLCATDPLPKALAPRTVYILPWIDADAHILSLEAGWEVRLLLAFYYRTVLGYPECTLDIRSGEDSFELEIFDTPPRFVGVKTQKCKLLSTNTHTMPDLTEHTLYSVYAGGIYRVIPVTLTDGLRPSVLPCLRALDGLPLARCALGLSGDTLILPPDTPPSPPMLAAAAICHADLGRGSVTLTADGIPFTVIDCGTEMKVLTPAALISKSII